MCALPFHLRHAFSVYAFPFLTQACVLSLCFSFPHTGMRFQSMFFLLSQACVLSLCFSFIHRRVFSDKLVSYDDKNWLDRQLFDLMRESFTPDLIRQVCACVCTCVCVYVLMCVCLCVCVNVHVCVCLLTCNCSLWLCCVHLRGGQILSCVCDLRSVCVCTCAGGRAPVLRRLPARS